MPFSVRRYNSRENKLPFLITMKTGSILAAVLLISDSAGCGVQEQGDGTSVAETVEAPKNTEYYSRKVHFSGR